MNIETLKTAFEAADLALGDAGTWEENLAAAKIYDEARIAYNEATAEEDWEHEDQERFGFEQV